MTKAERRKYTKMVVDALDAAESFTVTLTRGIAHSEIPGPLGFVEAYPSRFVTAVIHMDMPIKDPPRKALARLNKRYAKSIAPRRRAKGTKR